MWEPTHRPDISFEGIMERVIGIMVRAANEVIAICCALEGHNITLLHTEIMP